MFKVYLPTLGKFHNYRQINNHQFLELAKTIHGGDDSLIMAYLTRLVKESTDKQNTQTTLTKIDMFCVLLTMYIVCVSNELKLNTGDEARKVVNVSLNKILDVVSNYNQQYVTTLNIAKSVSVTLCIPASLYETQVDNIMLNSIKCIKLFGTKFTFENLSMKQKQQAFDRLPGEISTRVMQTMYKMNSKYKVDVIPGESKDQSLQLGLYDNTMYETIKLLYKSDLESLYYNRYVAAKHMKFQNEYVESITPAELQLQMKFLEKEIAEQQKANEKNNQPTSSVGGALPTPGGL